MMLNKLILLTVTTVVGEALCRLTVQLIRWCPDKNLSLIHKQKLNTHNHNIQHLWLPITREISQPALINVRIKVEYFWSPALICEMKNAFVSSPISKSSFQFESCIEVGKLCYPVSTQCSIIMLVGSCCSSIRNALLL